MHHKGDASFVSVTEGQGPAVLNNSLWRQPHRIVILRNEGSANTAKGLPSHAS
jgi:hypothetical protein